MKTARVLLPLLALIALVLPAQAADNLKEMFAQGSIKGQIRMMNYTRDFKNGKQDQQDSALGGLLYYKTAAFKGLSLGAAFGTTNGIGDYDDKNFYYGITAPGHENVTRLQEYYIEGNWFNTQIKLGAQELCIPFMTTHDVRMIPRSFRGLSVVNKSVENLSLSGLYLTDNVGWIDEEWVSFTKDIYIVGADYKLPITAVNTKVRAWYFDMPNSFNQSFFRVDFSKKINDFLLHGAPSYLKQDSQGNELDGELDTYQNGANLGVSAYGFDLTGFYAKTGDNSIKDDWGVQTKVIIQQVVTSGDALSGDRSDEKAYAARLAYDFGASGIKGLSAYVFYANYDAPASTINETDFNVQYAFSGPLDGLGIRARYAIIDKDSGQEDFTDARFMLTYCF